MFDELLSEIGLTIDYVNINNVLVDQTKNILKLDIDILKLISCKDMLTIIDLISKKTNLKTKINYNLSKCFDELIADKNTIWIKDFLKTQGSGFASGNFDVEFVDNCFAIKVDETLYSLIVSKGKDKDVIKKINKLFSCDVPINFVEIKLDIDIPVDDGVINRLQEMVQNHVESKPIKQPSGSDKAPYKRGKIIEDGMIYGKQFKGEPTPLNKIDYGRNIIIGKIFGKDIREIQKINKTVLSFSLTDYEGSVNAKLFLDNKIFSQLDEQIENGVWVICQGEYTIDSYTNANVFTPKSIIKTSDPYMRTDNCKLGKRVELHCHTQMSAMDCIADVKTLVKTAGAWGHEAIAITDHGVVQSFPDAYAAAKKAGIKIIYGCEGYIFDDEKSLILNSDDRSLDDTIVVFDLETTGFNPASEKITEIGAVKIKDGKIIDKFETLVNPQKPISAKITQITGITDNMVKDAPTIDSALKDFYEFAKGYTLSAHNASFDMSFILLNGRENGLSFDNPVIDTLSLSRILLPNLKNHKLDTLVKHFKIALDNHHRADCDAKATAEMLLQFIEMLKSKKLFTLDDVNLSDINRSQENQGMETSHIIILAKDLIGLKNLYKLVSHAHLDYFYKKPRIPKSLLKKYGEGLILGSACEQGEVFKAVLRRESQTNLKKIIDMYDYLEIQPTGNNMFLVRNGVVNGISDLEKLNKQIVDLGKKYGKPVVATCDVHFVEKRDEIYRKIILAGQGFSDANEDTPLYFRTTDEMLKEFSYLGDDIAKEVVIDNPNLIAKQCNIEKPFPDDKTYTPKIDGAEDEITQLTYNKAYELYGNPVPEIVQKRIDKELKSINGYGFAVLYLIAQKLVKKSLDDGYLVGSRGSVGSSFVAYLTGITEVNPMPPHYICTNCKHIDFDIDIDKFACGKDLEDKLCPVCGNELYKDGYDIPFEVFLGFEGDKVPDIDLNFSGEYQPIAHKYIEELFGEGHVFRAGTVSTLQDKTAYGFVKKYADEYGIDVSPADVNRLVDGCTGVKRTTGQHPGGIIIVPRDLDVYTFTPIQHPADSKDKGIITTHFDFNSMHDTLVKVDVLGHDDPTKLRILQDFTGIDPKTIPLDHKETMSLFSSTKALNVTEKEINSKVGTFGIPEFGTKFVRQMLVDTVPTTMAELVRISGLSHGTDVWINNAQDIIKQNIATLKDTICTRDDIMNSLMHMGVDPKTSFTIMESVRKGKGLKPEWEQTMIENNVPTWFIDSCKKIKYMFPKAHAAAYVMMAFRIAWYKVNFPLEFYATIFTIQTEDFDGSLMLGGQDVIRRNIITIENKNDLSVKDKATLTILELALEMHVRGFEFLPVDLHRSKADLFTIEDGKIRMPFRAISGLGDAVAKLIVIEREKAQFLSIEDLQRRTKINKTVLEVMKGLNCLDGMAQSNQLSLF